MGINLKVAIALLLLVTTAVFGADGSMQSANFDMNQEEAAGLMGMIMGIGIIGIIGVFAIFIIVWVFFIISQNNLIDAMSAKDSSVEPVSKAWTWTQLIPIWSIVALAVSIAKINAQHQEYVQHNGASAKPFNAMWGWAYLISVVVSSFLPFLGVVALVFLILYWVNIVGATKSIMLGNLQETQPETHTQTQSVSTQNPQQHTTD